LFGYTSLVVILAIIFLYLWLPHRWRWLWLLAASAIFYISFAQGYIVLLLFIAGVNYVSAIVVERAQASARRRLFVLSVAANLALLAIFKLPGLLEGDLEALTRLLGWNYPSLLLTIVLPIGLSFQIFQGISYLIEVYQGRYQAEKHAGIYAAYVMFFPVVLAGPIERPQNLLRQFHETHAFDYQRVVNGLRRMAWGFFKKAVIADRLALSVNVVYGHPRDYPDFMLPIVTVFFAYQIYCDFSGYSDMALGAAQVMGFKLAENFNRPYASTSITEFWQRWHMSLSSWIRDYLYMPAARQAIKITRGKYAGPSRFIISVVTMSLVGLWHGASLNFLIWGALHGSLLGLEGVFRARASRWWSMIPLGDRAQAIIKTGLTFTLICLAWVFFGARSLEEAFYMLAHLPGGAWQLISGSVAVSVLQQTFLLLQMDRASFIAVVAAVLLMEATQLGQVNNRLWQRVLMAPSWLRWLLYYLLILFTLFYGVFRPSQFIYFQF